MQLGFPTTSLNKSAPTRLLFITTVCVFVAEALIMMLFTILPVMSIWAEVIIDATLIFVIILPVLYMSLLKPLQQSIKSHEDSEEKFRALAKYSPTAIYLSDKNGDCIYANPTWLKHAGMSLKDALGKGWIEALHPDDRKVVSYNWYKSVQSGGEWNFEYRFLSTKGVITHLYGSATSILNEAGELTGYVGTNLDITESKQALEKVERLAAFAELNPAPLFKTEFNGKITLINVASRNLFNRDVTGEFIQEVLPGIADLLIIPGQNRILVPIEQKLGDEIYLFNIKKDEPTQSIYIYGSIITETRRLEELESRAARLDTAGTIAGQVAHDFNNLLAPMMAYPDFIREELSQNHPALGYVDDIEKAAKKIAEINQQLLTLGRRGHYTQETLNLNTIIHQAVKEVTPQSNIITFVKELDPELMNVNGGGSQIHRVITNLLYNAIDAIQDVGHIVVKTENYHVVDASHAFGHVPKGEYVKLTITDTGCGISGDIIQQILDPFFTTKVSDKERGSGLGLSVVDSVVKDHNGYLDLDTKLGQGTSFYIYFPATHKLSNQDQTETIIGGCEKILLVDDDDIQREVSNLILERLGYEVSSVDSGEKAIEFLKGNPQDLLILDMVMPGGLDGAETYQQIHNFNPNQKAIIVSGFSESGRVLLAQKLGVGAFVKKPLTKQIIATAIRTELERNVQSEIICK